MKTKLIQFISVPNKSISFEEVSIPKEFNEINCTLEIENIELNLNLENNFPHKIIGHRGMGQDKLLKNLNVNENSIESFLLAHKNKADMIEFDVHLIKNNDLIVFHDSKINNKNISEMDITEINTILPKLKLSKLKDLFENLPEDLGFNIEIKYLELEINNSEQYLELLTNQYKTILEIIKLIISNPKYLKRNIFFSSFSYECCILIKKICPKFLVYFLIEDPTAIKYFGNDYYKDLTSSIQTANLDGIVIDTEIYNKLKDQINILNKINKKVFCYGNATNKKEEGNNLLKNGISGIITDFVEEFK